MELILLLIVYEEIIDIVSAGSCEMEKRYGVIYVDADNKGKSYCRYKKDSFYWYQQFIEKVSSIGGNRYEKIRNFALCRKI